MTPFLCRKNSLRRCFGLGFHVSKSFFFERDDVMICYVPFEKRYTPQNKHGTWKWTLGKGDSYWKPSFPGSMLIFGGVLCSALMILWCLLNLCWVENQRVCRTFNSSSTSWTMGGRAMFPERIWWLYKPLMLPICRRTTCRWVSSFPRMPTNEEIAPNFEDARASEFETVVGKGTQKKWRLWWCALFRVSLSRLAFWNLAIRL